MTNFIGTSGTLVDRTPPPPVTGPPYDITQHRQYTSEGEYQTSSGYMTTDTQVHLSNAYWRHDILWVMAAQRGNMTQFKITAGTSPVFEIRARQRAGTQVVNFTNNAYTNFADVGMWKQHLISIKISLLWLTGDIWLGTWQYSGGSNKYPAKAGNRMGTFKLSGANPVIKFDGDQDDQSMAFSVVSYKNQ